MAELLPEVMFRRDELPGYSELEIAALNFELGDRLGPLKPGSALYLESAKAFHLEVAKRPKSDRPTMLL